jgi:flagellar biosynthetic protein FliR
MEIFATQFILFLVLLVRAGALVIVAPITGHLAVPVQVKVALSLFLAFVLYPLAAAQAPGLDTRLPALALTVVREAGMGAVLGFVAGLIFAGARAAGELVGFELGFSLAQTFDPENGQQSSIIGQMFSLALTLIFLLLNGHHFVLQSLLASYDVVPVDGLRLAGPLTNQMVSLTGSVFVLAARLAAPVIVAGFLVNLAMSILARVAPQVNVFILSFSLKVAIGLIVLTASAPLMVAVFKKLLADVEQNLLDLVRVL